MDRRLKIAVDVEITNRCNAHCVMCPREAVRDLGRMDEEVFARVLARCVEYDRIRNFSFAGLGEPLLHPRLVEWVGRAKAAGLNVSVVTNAALLTRPTARGLVSAGLDNLNVSIGGYSKETYEKVQRGLCFERVRENLLGAIEIARGTQCKVNLHISPSPDTQEERDEIIRYWELHGIDYCFEFTRAANRGGLLRLGGNDDRAHPNGECRRRHAINIEELLRPTPSERKRIEAESRFQCAIKSLMTFIDWRGRVYLCCNDFRKQVVVGNVRTHSLEETNAAKNALALSDLPMCRACNLREEHLVAKGLAFYWQLAECELLRRWRKLLRPAGRWPRTMPGSA